MKLQHWGGSLLIGLFFGCSGPQPTTTSPASETKPKASAPALAPVAPAPASPTAELVVLSVEGVVRLADGSGKTKSVFGQGIRSGRLQCAHQGERVVVVSPREVRRYSVSKSEPERLDMPEISFCKGDSSCRIHRLTADAAADALCAEISDGPPATASNSSIVRIRFEAPREAKAGECLVESAPEASALSADGQFSVHAEEGSCGDYCYQTVVITDERALKVVKSIEDVPVGTPIEWAPQGSGLLIGGTLHDAAQAGLQVELGQDACWLRK